MIFCLSPLKYRNMLNKTNTVISSPTLKAIVMRTDFVDVSIKCTINNINKFYPNFVQLYRINVFK